jgi:hypothetical protein
MISVLKNFENSRLLENENHSSGGAAGDSRSPMPTGEKPIHELKPHQP